MATLILKSLALGFLITGIGTYSILGFDEAPFISIFYFPFAFWPATLIISVLVALVFEAIKENSNK